MAGRYGHGNQTKETDMQATIKEFDANVSKSNRIGSIRDKELLEQYSLLQPDGEEILTLRLYASRRRDGASPVYAVAWLYGQGYRTATGVARGYGYDKASAAAFQAFTRLGIAFDKHWGGAGESAVRDALKAVARALDVPEAFVHHAHA